MCSNKLKIKKVGVAWLAALVVLASLSGIASAQTYPVAADKGLNWIRTQQQPDGSFAGFGAGSTVDAVLAISAAQLNPNNFMKGNNTPVTYLQSKAADLAKTPGSAGKLLLAVESLGMDGKEFGGLNLVEVVNASYDANTGQYGKDAIGHAFVMLGLKWAGEPIPPKAAAFLESIQTADGGWAFSGETAAGSADTNTTAVAVQALTAAGASGTPAVQKAEAYLMSQQGDDGGFPYQKGGEFGSESDVNSTAYVAQALMAMGLTAERPLQFILSMQKPNGAFQWKPTEADDNAGATYQAITALLGATLATPGTSAGQAQTGGPGTSTEPGMPRTGNSDSGPIAAIAVLTALALGLGAMTRRRAAQ